MLRIAFALGLFLLWLSGVFVTPTMVMAAGIHVDAAWARPTFGNQKTSAAYLFISNAGPGEDALIAVKSAVARKVMLHSTVMDGNVARMRPLESLTLPAGKTIVFEPGGHHIMLMGLEAPLAVGDKVPLTLIFKNHPPLEVTARVMLQPPPLARGSFSGASE